MRHAFQYSEILAFKRGEETHVDTGIIKKWISESEEYIGILDENGNMRPSYYKQHMEFDAFAFSYAVIKYKYGEVPYLSKPTQYGDEFDKDVDKWYQTFKLKYL